MLDEVAFGSAWLYHRWWLETKGVTPRLDESDLGC